MGLDGQPAPQQQSSLSFTEGFLLGQLSIVLFIGAFIKFFIFGDPPSPEKTASARASARRNRDHGHKRSLSSNSSPSTSRSGVRVPSSNILRHPPRLTTPIILAKTYYNVNAHQPESLDWFNVLIAQTIAQFRTDAHQDEAILTSLTDVLNGSQKPDFLSSIKVTEISLGEDFPILSNCRVHPVDDGSAGPDGARLQAHMDVDLSDLITLGVETKMILNWPKPLTAVLPVALAVSIVRFSGTLSISFLPSASHSNASTTAGNQVPLQQPPSTTPTSLAFSFLPDYRLDLSVRSLVGSRSRLQDIPKIAQMVENRLHAWIDERCVEPRVQQVVLPSLWPRKKNTRGPLNEDDEGLGIKTPEITRDIHEEARREVEEERRKDREHREREAAGFAEGLRWRSKAEGGGSRSNAKMAVSQASDGLGDPKLLQVIDKLVELNIGESVALPQLLVVGDQSSGKSSVLEGLTGLPFPRDSKLCTRFATHITFKRASITNISVSIIPDKNTSKAEVERLRAWKKTGVKSLDRKEFSNILAEVHTAMRIGEVIDGVKQTFSDDVLKIEVAGPDEQHLSVVDVPGIFSLPEEGLTTKADIANVRAMAQRHMANSRSVILPVIPANVDIATQEIVDMARTHDPKGQRTLGVLTKPDLVDRGAEQAILDIMRGVRQKLNLGWCMVRNPGQKDLSEETFDRDALEKSFFKNEAPWSTLDKERVGVASLRLLLVELLTEVVRREFANVRTDVIQSLKDSERKLQALGPCRENKEQQQKYLLDLASKFRDMTNQALEARYEGALESNQNLSLATLVVDRNEQFAKDVWLHGHTRNFHDKKEPGVVKDVVEVSYDDRHPIVEQYVEENEGQYSEASPTSERSEISLAEGAKTRYRDSLDDIDELLTDNRIFTSPTNGIMEWLETVYRRCRGFETGTFNASLVDIVWQKQSWKWRHFALGYTSDVVVITHSYIRELLLEICVDDRVQKGVLLSMMDKLAERYQSAMDQTQLLFDVEKEPMTYNHYFAENLEKCEQERMKAQLAPQVVTDRDHGRVIKEEALDTILANKSNVQSTIQRLHDIVRSYYKVARKRFVDNVCMQATARQLVRGPDAAVRLFSPSFVSGLSTEDLDRIAGEDLTTKRKRAELTREIENFKAAKKLLLAA
ncbi:MAG: hypothetical protein Q9174_003331 [Haloplaca sp. 1 TL-2023]